MRPLTDRDKRTVRIAAVGIGIYLILFFGFQAWRGIERKRAAYLQLLSEAQNLRSEIQPYKNKVLVVSRLMEDFHLDPAKLSRQTVVADASAAIQNTAAASGVQLGTIHETPARPSSREMAAIQLDGTGPVPAVMALLDRMKSLGYPLVIDSLQLTRETRKPGQIKFNLTVIILDFDRWKNEPAPVAKAGLNSLGSVRNPPTPEVPHA